MIRLRHLAGINPPTTEFDRLPDDAEIPFVPLEAVWPGGVDPSRRKSKAVVSTGYTRFLEGDIVVPKITPTFQADRTTIVRGIEGGVAAGTTELHVVRPGPSVDRRYIRYLLSTRTFLHGGEAEMIGVAGQKRVPDAWVRDLPVPVIDIGHQQEIADYLDDETTRIDALVDKKRHLIEALNERFRSYRASEMLQGMDPITGAGHLPSGWSNVSLGVCVQLQRGHDLPDQQRVEGEVPIISSGGVSGWHNESSAQGPGVVTGRYGTIGDAYYVEGPYWPLNTTLYVRDFRSNDPRWVLHVLSTLPLDSESAKSAVTGINRNVIGQLRVARPPTSDQRAIASRVDGAKAKVDETVAALSRQIDLLVERRQALITAAVTGELSGPGVAA